MPALSYPPPPPSALLLSSDVYTVPPPQLITSTNPQGREFIHIDTKRDSPPPPAPQPTSRNAMGSPQTPQENTTSPTTLSPNHP
jgi:hypothetical protein